MKKCIKQIVKTEKTQLLESLSCYVFLVDKSFSKLKIKKVIEKEASVKIKNIRTLSYKKSKSLKKACITFNPNQNLSDFLNTFSNKTK